MSSRKFQKKKRENYLAPFFILILLGCFSVIGIKTILYFTKDESYKAAADKGIIEVIKGQADLLSYGEKNWHQTTGEEAFLVGDGLKTQDNSKVSIFFGGESYLRMNDNSEVVFFEEEEMREDRLVRLLIKTGEFWIKGDKQARIELALDKVKIISNKRDIFSVVNNTDKMIRVLEGDVLVVFTAANGEDVMKEISLKAGEKMILGSKTDGYYAIENIESSFAETMWYLWNMAEDKKESKVAETAQPVFDFKFAEEQDKPEIRVLSPDEKIIEIEGTKIQIIGIATLDAKKVIVTAYTAFGKDEYTLRKYVPGEKWIYTADKKLENLAEGENRYEIKAVREDGVESEVTKIIVKR